MCPDYVVNMHINWCFFFSSRRRHTRCSRDWSSDVCSSDLRFHPAADAHAGNSRTRLRGASPFETAFVKARFALRPHPTAAEARAGAASRCVGHLRRPTRTADPARAMLSGAVMAGVPHPVATIDPAQLQIFLLQCGLLLALALALGRLAARVGMPAVVGELLAGALMGPSVLGHLAPGLSAWLLAPRADQFPLLDAVGQIAVILRVGITGIQVDVGLIRRQGATAARVSAAGLLVP